MINETNKHGTCLLLTAQAVHNFFLFRGGIGAQIGVGGEAEGAVGMKAASQAESPASPPGGPGLAPVSSGAGPGLASPPVHQGRGVGSGASGRWGAAPATGRPVRP